MGYYTRHELTVINGDNKTDYEQEINKFIDYHDAFGDEIKWYNCQTDMIEFSKKYPEVTFLIDGYGEESGDIWKAWFKDGKTFYSKAKLVFNEYSDDKLE